jgi:cysteine desulfurase
MIYLDNNATTAVAPAVLAAMLPYFCDQYANPSSVHRFGQEARQAVEHARHQVSALLHCQPREIIFTSGGTESDNAAILGVLAAQPAKKTIVTSVVEHSAVRQPLEHLAKTGYRIIKIPVSPAGRLDLAALAAALADPDAALASIMWANNETGVIFDIPAIADLARAHRVPLHVDAVQAAGKIPIDLAALAGVELLSVSAHKFYGPKGAGALFVRRNARWLPLIRGGPQERDRRGGTENVPAIVGLGAAAEMAAGAIASGAQASIAALRDRLEAGILQSIPDAHVIGDPASRLANTTNIGFAGLEAEAILLLLSEREICASAGAACSSGSLEPSPVLLAMGIPERIAHGAIRFSLSGHTTQDEIDQTLAAMPPLIARLRAVLPVAKSHG